MLRFFRLIIRLLDKQVSLLCNILNLLPYGINLNNVVNVKGRIYVSGAGTLKIGSNFRANSGRNYNVIGGDTRSNIIVGTGATLVIGNNCGISNSTLVCQDKIIIGNNVLIGGSVKIYDTDFHAKDPKNRTTQLCDKKYTKTKPIKVGDNAFIGAHSIILKGSSVGKNSIIGAGSVISGNIPDNQVWAGNPARHIGNIPSEK